MTKSRAFAISARFSEGQVCTLKENEVKEYHAMFNQMLGKEYYKIMRNRALTIQELIELVKSGDTHIWIKDKVYNITLCGIVDIRTDVGICAIYSISSRSKVINNTEIFVEKDYENKWVAYKYNPNVSRLEWYQE